MKRRTPLQAKQRLQRGTGIKPKARSAAEFDRVYGSKRRAKIMRERPCDHCGKQSEDWGSNQNAHTESGGMGRKAGWQTIVSLCPECHRVYHWLGSAEKFNEVSGTDLKAIARRLAEEIEP